MVDHRAFDPFNHGTLGVFAIEVYVLVKIQNFKVFRLKLHFWLKYGYFWSKYTWQYFREIGPFLVKTWLFFG